MPAFSRCLVCARGCLVAEDVSVQGLMAPCLQEANSLMKRDSGSLPNTSINKVSLGDVSALKKIFSGSGPEVD